MTTEWILPTVQLAMVFTVLVLTIGIYRHAPGMFANWLATKERMAKFAAEERDRERAWQTKRDTDDYLARHNDRNVLMVGQSELVQQIMAGNDRALKIVVEGVCRYRETCSPG